MITTLWGTIAVLIVGVLFFFLGICCVVQAVVGIKLFIEEKQPIFLVSAIIYLVGAVTVVYLFLEILR